MINGEQDLLLEHQPLDESCSTQEYEKLQEEYEQLEERFNTYYQENQASCHHFIGEFRINSGNYAPFVGRFLGYDYFTEREILTFVSKLIRCVKAQSGEGFENYEIQIATLYDLESLENLEPHKYQYHEYSDEKVEGYINNLVD